MIERVIRFQTGDGREFTSKEEANHHESNCNTAPTQYHERVQFRLIQMACCGQLLCWVNPRYPSHCPECGKLVYPEVKGCVRISDPNATLSYAEVLT